MIDKNRVMVINSSKEPTDSYCNIGDFLMSYNQGRDHVLIEAFDFKNKRVFKVFESDKLSSDHPHIWDMGGFDRLEFLLSTLNWKPGNEFRRFKE